MPLDRAARSAVAELVARYALPDDAEARLVELAALLVADPRAPTRVRGPLPVVEQHLADSLVALELPAVGQARRAVDLGSGPGLPGLALAIALPEAGFALVESSGRKCEFLEEAVLRCGLSNVAVVNDRAEAWREGLDGFDLVTARALGPLEVVIEYAAPLMSVGGSLVAWRGRRDPDAEAIAGRAAELIGLHPEEVRKVRPFAGAENRHLHLMSKVVETPSGFPRRPGVARKRPLGHDIAPKRQFQPPSDRRRR